MSEASADHAPELQRRKPLPPLHEIAAAMRAVLDVIDGAEGEVTDADARMLDELGLTLGEKAEVLALVHAELLAAAVASLAVAKPYLDRAKRLQGQAERLKDRLYAALETAGIDRAVGPTGGGARLQFGAPVVQLDASRDIPAEYEYVKRTPNLDAIRAALKAGPLEFATLVQRRHLRWL